MSQFNIPAGNLVTNLTIDNREFKAKLAESQSDAERVMGRMGQVIESQTEGSRRLAGSLSSAVGAVTGVLGTVTVVVGLVTAGAAIMERWATASERAAEAARQELERRQSISTAVNSMRLRSGRASGRIPDFEAQRQELVAEATERLFGEGGVNSRLSEAEGAVYRGGHWEQVWRGTRKVGRPFTYEDGEFRYTNKLDKYGDEIFGGAEDRAKLREARREWELISEDLREQLSTLERERVAEMNRIDDELTLEGMRNRGDERGVELIESRMEDRATREEIRRLFGEERLETLAPVLDTLRDERDAEINRRYDEREAEARERAERERVQEARDARRLAFETGQGLERLEVERLRSVGEHGAASALERELSLAREVFEIRENTALSDDERTAAIEKRYAIEKNLELLHEREESRARRRRAENATLFAAQRLGDTAGGSTGRAIERLIASNREYAAIAALGVDDPAIIDRLLDASDASISARFADRADPSATVFSSGFGGFDGGGSIGLRRIVGASAPSLDTTAQNINQNTQLVIRELEDINQTLRDQLRQSGGDPLSVTGNASGGGGGSGGVVGEGGGPLVGGGA